MGSERLHRTEASLVCCIIILVLAIIICIHHYHIFPSIYTV